MSANLIERTFSRARSAPSHIEINENSPINLKEYFHYSLKKVDAALGEPQSGRNNDVLLGGTLFIKGNQYSTQPEDEEERKQESRYFTDKSTIRCRNCLEFGHMSSTCPNEHVNTRVCIYCGDSSHDQFNCPNRLCFICNRKGHKAATCTHKHEPRCFRCKQIGHKLEYCLVHPTEIAPKEVQQIICIQCRRQGHACCKTESLNKQIIWNQQSTDIKNVNVVENLEKLRKQNNVKYNLTEDVHYTNKALCARYKQKEHESKSIYCPYCGGPHVSTHCARHKIIFRAEFHEINSRFNSESAETETHQSRNRNSNNNRKRGEIEGGFLSHRPNKLKRYQQY